MILQALFLFSFAHAGLADDVPAPCPPRFRQSVQEVGCSTGLFVSTTSSECLSIEQCDDTTKVLSLGTERWEQSYTNVFLCCPDDVEGRVESPQTEEDCTMKCLLENGIASVPTWTSGTCTCSLTVFAQCDPFGEVAQGYNTCEKYFNHFADNNCNYNLQAHQVCAGEDFDYDNYVQIRDLCPEQCATVEYEEDSLDETVSFDLEGTGETLQTPGRRQLLKESWRVGGAYYYTSYKPIGAYVYEHTEGKGKAWHVKTRGCCSRWWPWSGCRDSCRESGHRNIAYHIDNIISSVSVRQGCNLDLYQHNKGLAILWSAWSPYKNKNGDSMMNMNVHRNDDASSYKLQCWW